MKIAIRISLRLARALTLLVLVAIGTIALMRFAPGYFTDPAEMDGQYAGSARSRLQKEQAREGTVLGTTRRSLGSWLHADFGLSRQYGIPVTALLRPRLGITAFLLFRGIAWGWLGSFTFALALSGRRGPIAFLGAPFTLLLAIPTGAMATLCLLSNVGGPVLVLTLLIAARDFRFLKSTLDAAWTAPHLLQARAQGFSFAQLARTHVLRSALPQLRALVTMSLVTALSALVPVEVLFDVHGIGQLAFSAAMNRDLPVLLAVTLVMAAAVSLANMFSEPIASLELA